jgi:excinuclease ABC subunit B
VALPSPKKSEAEASADPLELIAMLRSDMLLAAENLEFEKAAQLRDRIKKLEAQSGGAAEAGGAKGARKPTNRMGGRSAARGGRRR